MFSPVAKGFYFKILNLSLKCDATNLLVISARVLNVSDTVCVCTYSQLIADGKLLKGPCINNVNT